VNARVDPRLIEALRRKTKLSDRQLRRLIGQRVNRDALSRRAAALSVARDYAVPLSRFATTEDFAELRHGGHRSDPVEQPASPSTSSRSQTGRTAPSSRIRKVKKTHDNSVWVVSGRNESVRADFFALLRSMGLNPIEWTKALSFTKKGSPYVGEVLDEAFKRAAAVVVLLTPDDDAMLRREFQRASDPAWEKRLTGQPRPNVLFEAGMAFGSHPHSTVLVQIGKIREFSDVAGRHVVRLSNSTYSRQELATKLQSAGCRVDLSGTDWHTVGNF
jgi:predicted nucleotide-binding protein